MGTAAKPFGSLTVVGSGIRFGLQTTPEARRAIDAADTVLYVFSDPVPSAWIERVKPGARPLDVFYEPGKDRDQTYDEMVEEILTCVRRGEDVCVVFYGHPGVFATPSHRAIQIAREEGFRAAMLPGVSAEDCLFADLGVDPGEWGCQSFEATRFLLNRPAFDPSAILILWQIGTIGEGAMPATPNRDALRLLGERLGDVYGREHHVAMYEASPYPIGQPFLAWERLDRLAEAEIPPMATLYIPPLFVPRGSGGQPSSR